MRTPRVRAPELQGRGWLNTDTSLSLAALRGRFVLLDFWTFCCINCLHVLDELRPVEQRYADELVVVGVHSPKFAHEADPDALAQAVERYDVRHPVLDDPELLTWQAYTARAWPTLVLVDPEGYVVAQYAGEGHGHAVDRLLAEQVPVHEAKGTLTRGRSPYVPPRPTPGDLRFPAKVVGTRQRTWLVADTGHHRVVELAGDAETVLRTFGDGERGLRDGDADTARFSEPNGLCVLPDDVAREVGYDVVVADTVNHALRGLDVATGGVRTLVRDLRSPWDVEWHDGRVWVAMAGVHQLWTFEPGTGETRPVAGTATEGLRDGPLRDAWFAQTSGLASDGERLWLADSETSSLRWVSPGGTGGGEVRTAVGTGLFDFGFRDGPAAHALLQHPLGVGVLPDGSVAVADTYNGAVRRFDPAAGELTTLATGLAEPSGLALDGDTLLVVESGAHRLTRVPLGAHASASGFTQSTQRPVTEVGPETDLVVTFEPPPGQKVDERFGPPSQLMVTATPPALLREGGGTGTDLTRRLVLDPAVGGGVLHVAARAASCDVDGGEGAACHLHQQDWGVPVRVADGGSDALVLPLGGRTGSED